MNISEQHDRQEPGGQNQAGSEQNSNGSFGRQGSSKGEPIECDCGLCDTWRGIVEAGRKSRIFTRREYACLGFTFGKLLWDGEAHLTESDYLDPVPDSVGEKIGDRVDGQRGQFFDNVDALATRSAGVPHDTYAPGSLIRAFDSEPNGSCNVLRSALMTEDRGPKHCSFFSRVRAASRASATQHRPHQPGPHGSHARKGAPADRARPSTVHGAKDSSKSAEESDNQGSERSDGISGALVFGRDSGVREVIEKGGIHFCKRWWIREPQARMIEVATEGLANAPHHFFVHAVRSTISELRKGDGWFPFWYEHIRTALPVTEEQSDKTALVWGPLVRRGLLGCRKHNQQAGVAREFKVDHDWIQQFVESRFKDEDPNTMIDAFTGHVRPQQKRQTRLTNHNENKYSGSLLKGLNALKESSRQFNKREVEDLLVHKKRKAEEARQEVEQQETDDYKEYKQAFFKVRPGMRAEGYSDTDSFKQWKLLYEGQKYTTEFLRYRKLRKSYLNDLQCYASILRQRPEHVKGGIYEYDTAWNAQAISGRVSEVGGGLQSASKEMKAAAYTGIETHNYDIKGSQLGDVIKATEMVSSIDTAELRETYLKTSKSANADKLCIERGTYKDLLYGTTFLGSWSYDVSTALAQANPFTGVPETLKILRQAGWEEGIDVQATYKKAQSHFFPLKKAVRKLADYLLGEYWEEQKYNAGGWVMKNACGVTFRKSDYEDASKHKIRSKVLAWYLQGAEADKMHRLAARCREEGIVVMGNEHDGVITTFPISGDLKDEVLAESTLERKPFDEHYVETAEVDEDELDDLQEDVNEAHRK